MEKEDKTNNNNNNNNSIPSTNPQNNIKEKIEQGNIFNDEISLLENLWNKLYVTNNFRYHFINNTMNLTVKEREPIFENEKVNLEKLAESLNNLKEEITSRKNKIKSLKNYIINIEKYISEKNAINKDSRIFEEICNTITELISNRIKIINLIIYINKVILSNKEKWNLNEIKKKYLYDPNYLDKIKEDMSFLKNSILNKFIDINDSIYVPFFNTSTVVSKDNNNNNKIKIKINDELKKEINDLRYLLAKESINSNINKNNNITNNTYNSNNTNIIISKRNIKKNNLTEIELNTQNNFNKNKITFNRFSHNDFQIYRKSNKKLRKNILSGNLNIKISQEIYNQKKGKIYSEIFKTNSQFFSKEKIKLPNIYQTKYDDLKKLLLNEKNKNKELNDEIIELKKLNLEFRKQNLELKNSNEQTLNKLHEKEKAINEKEIDINIIQNELREQKTKNNELLEENNKIVRNYRNNNEISDLKNKVKELEQKLNEKEEENQKCKEEVKKYLEMIENKDKEILNLKNEINELKLKQE